MRRLCFLNNTIRWAILLICCVFWSVVSFSFSLYDMWPCLISYILHMFICFSPFVFFLFHPKKYILAFFYFWSFDFGLYLFCLWFFSLFFYKKIVYFQFSSSTTVYHIHLVPFYFLYFSFDPYSFVFWFFSSFL